MFSTCSKCSTRVLANPVDDESALYPENYYSISRDPATELSSPPFRLVVMVLARLALWRRRRLLVLIRLVTPLKEARTMLRMLEAVALALPRTTLPRILDVGTGSGYLPHVLSRSPSVRVLGIDPHMSDTQAAHSPHLKKSTVDSLPQEEKWDLIVFNHSLEHMHSALDVIAAARDRLAPGGRILIRVPTVSSQAFDAYGADSHVLDPPRHIFVPSRKGLEACTTASGLRVVHQYDDSSSPQFWMSDHIAAGRSTMDPADDFRSYRRAEIGPHRLAALAARSWWANRTHRGDQLCMILEAA